MTTWFLSCGPSCSDARLDPQLNAPSLTNPCAFGTPICHVANISVRSKIRHLSVAMRRDKKRRLEGLQGSQRDF